MAKECHQRNGGFRMALTRKWLSALGIDVEKIEEIIKAHTETVEGLKAEIDKYKADAEKLPGVESERDKLKEAVKNDKTKELQKQYDELKAEYEGYKSDVKGKEVQATRTKAYRTLLKEAGVSEKRIDSILKITDLSQIDYDEDNKIVDADKVTESIKTEWAEFIPIIEKKGVDVANPPANNGGGVKTKEEIMAIKDTAERQKAIAENHELFGI